MKKITPYLQRLNDGRTVWYHGEIITNLDQHPAFKGTISSIDSLLNLQSKEDTQPLLTYKTEEGAHAHLSFLVPHTHKDLELKRLAYKSWADHTFGVMSRLSEYSRSLITGWYANRNQYESSYPGFSKKIEDYYEKSRKFDLLSTAAGHDPQKNRGSASEEKDSSILHVTRKNNEGIFVRGAKMIATAAPYVDELLIYSFHKRGEKEREFANVFFVPTNAKGLHIVCRDSFAEINLDDYPLSSRFDEMDAVLIFDDVFIPWERVIVLEDPEFAWKIRNDKAGSLLSQHQTVVRLVSKLESIAAIGNELAENAGATQFLHVKEMLAELIIQLETIKALLIASEHKATLYNGILLPDKDALATARNLGTKYYPKALELLQRIGAGGLLQAPSSVNELNGPIGHLLEEYFRGTYTSAEERTRFTKLAWDIIGSSLGARHELYERFYSGDPVRTYAAQYQNYNKRKQLIDYAYELII
ncbi:4-hydroxyphenylacetate 3-hydroxylase (plasmid) [Cytobacillus oceanisediminis]|uniref:4-hydroxyphenylacetate 3-hydroxylase family protein n=1 Tax=Cytobacillus oceanisediminis TaxID=665099 RepID=UPI001863CDF5|nr:4-hydroxyphenylacetate 3-hydroxylase N-terminal domain-containing protein [Cytobacillus oceanisediminis]QOK29884.1 4-hydroxyphenylacetate 3-hydroxylase [Cytobacillus oceanisediminis]